MVENECEASVVSGKVTFVPHQTPAIVIEEQGAKKVMEANAIVTLTNQESLLRWVSNRVWEGLC